MQFNAQNLKKKIDSDFAKVIKPQIDKLVAEEIERQRDDVLAEMEEELEERETLLGRKCHPLQQKACHLEARNGFIIEFRKKGYLSQKFYQSKDWLSIAYRMRRKKP